MSDEGKKNELLALLERIYTLDADEVNGSVLPAPIFEDIRRILKEEDWI